MCKNLKANEGDLVKIHVPAFKAMAKCNAHLDHGAFDLEISDEALREMGYEKVVRCKDCRHSERLPEAAYEEFDEDVLACKIGRGDNAYISAVRMDGFCDDGEI